MRYRTPAALLFLLWLGSFPLQCASAQDQQVNKNWDGSLTTPVHLIPLKDEFDQPIFPGETYPLPFSHRFTCAPCHAYETIRQGLHFNAGSQDTPGRPGEPWVWLDARTGTVLPLSLRGWEHTWHPRDLGLTAWDFTGLFARHMTGGGVSEVPPEEYNPDSRWEVSGRLEINCLGCHNASPWQSHSEWAKQGLRQNYRWAATAASGLGTVGGMASRLPGTWLLLDGPNPDDTEWAVVPHVEYRSELFDPKFNVYFEIADRVENSRCLTCHSATPVGLDRFQVSEDVHTAAGLRCVDCHRHDLSHRMVRGYEGEAEEYAYPESAAFSCRGCHLGEKLRPSASGPAGSLGAPRPPHPGIPAVHFERLSCTACHSGALPRSGLTRVRTSRANRLGIYGIAQWATDLPDIREPVYARDGSGMLTPRRVLWPSFWARIQGEELIPLSPQAVSEQGVGILDAEEFTARLLGLLALTPDLEGTPGIFQGGKVFTPNPDGYLEVEEAEETAADPDLFWALQSGDEVLPLIPQFDPQAELPDQDAEIRIQQVLEALAGLESGPARAAILVKQTLYVLESGYLELKEFPEAEPPVFPDLVWWDDKRTQPLLSGFQQRTVLALAGREERLTEEQVSLLLTRLSQAGEAHAYISQGRLFRLETEGALSVSEHQAAEPVSWPLAHPVRPAQQSLGIKACTDCHRENSEFFFSRVPAAGPLLTEAGEVRSAVSFMGMDRPYQQLFGLSFRVRPLLKWVLAAAALLLALLLGLVLVRVLGQSAGLIEKGE